MPRSAGTSSTREGMRFEKMTYFTTPLHFRPQKVGIEEDDQGPNPHDKEYGCDDGGCILLRS